MFLAAMANCTRFIYGPTDVGTLSELGWLFMLVYIVFACMISAYFFLATRRLHRNIENLCAM